MVTGGGSHNSRSPKKYLSGFQIFFEILQYIPQFFDFKRSPEMIEILKELACKTAW